MKKRENSNKSDDYTNGKMTNINTSFNATGTIRHRCMSSKLVKQLSL